MHLVEHETPMPETPYAYEITWESCACGRPQDHVRQPETTPTAWELEEFLMPEDMLATVA